MSIPRVAVQLSSLRQPLRQGLLLASRMEVSAVALDAQGELHPSMISQTGLRHLRKLLEDARLRVCSVRYRTQHGYDTIENLQPRIEGTKAAMRLAYALGAPIVVNQVGTIAAEEGGPGWEIMLEALHDLGQFGLHVGATLAATTGSESPEALARLIATLPDGFLMVDLDPGNLVANGHTPMDAIDRLSGHIRHVRATDAVRDHARGGSTDVPIGRGMVDFALMLARLSEHGYRGYLTVDRPSSVNPVHEVGLAVQYLQRIMSENP